MHCPKCGATSGVVETREINGNNRRRRRCDDNGCDHRFTTLETVVHSRMKHQDIVSVVLPKVKARELREALALLDRGLAGELSQHFCGDTRDSEPERAEGAEGDPLAVVPPPRVEEP